METRNYIDLQNEVNRLYENHNENDLRKLVYKLNNETRVKSDAPIYTIKYDEGKEHEHTIELKIPGKKTFENRYGKLQKTIQKQDIQIRVTKPDGTSAVVSHEDIIVDLYKKINGDYDNYIWYRNLLNLIHSNENLNVIEGIENIYEVEVNGYDLPTLISFFRWCGTQENINYPYGWGKDLSFTRYFEAIYAGYKQNEDLRKLICERANKEGTPPWLYENVNIGGESIDLYNGCLDSRKFDKDGNQRTIKLCERCYEYEALEGYTLCECCEIEESQKYIAEEESGTKQYEQEEIEELFGNCLYDIRTTLEEQMQEKFQQYDLKASYNDIDNNFNGTMFNVEINNTEIEVKVKYEYIGDAPSDHSYVNLVIYVDKEEIESRYVEFINGEYEWNSEQSSHIPKTDAEFKFDEADIEEFVNLIIEEVENIIQP